MPGLLAVSMCLSRVHSQAGHANGASWKHSLSVSMEASIELTTTRIGRQVATLPAPPTPNQQPNHSTAAQTPPPTTTARCQLTISFTESQRSCQISLMAAPLTKTVLPHSDDQRRGSAI
jgi:hypothetical protein